MKINLYEIAEQVDWELSPLSQRHKDIEKLAKVLRKVYQQGRIDGHKSICKGCLACQGVKF